MLFRKVVCISVVVFAVLAAPVLPQCVPSHRAPFILADGAGPAPPPIPLSKQKAPVMLADGAGPAPPPIPLSKQKAPVMLADGAGPAPPPIPLRNPTVAA